MYAAVTMVVTIIPITMPSTSMNAPHPLGASPITWSRTFANVSHTIAYAKRLNTNDTLS